MLFSRFVLGTIACFTVTQCCFQGSFLTSVRVPKGEPLNTVSRLRNKLASSLCATVSMCSRWCFRFRRQGQGWRRGLLQTNQENMIWLCSSQCF
ncbi:hypothetical protein V6N13_081343 [Hibiscus sabdariffa]